MEALIITVTTIVVFFAGFLLGRLDRSDRRRRPLSAKDLTAMLREPGVDPFRMGGLF